MTVALITPPASEPLGLSEIKAHLRIDHDHEDVLLTELLKTARQHTEFASGQKLITQVWRQYESCLPENAELPLKVGPVQSVETVTAFDASGAPHVLASNDFQLIRGSEPSHLGINLGSNAHLFENGCEIDVVVGIGDLGIDVPETLKRAILLLIAHW